MNKYIILCFCFIYQSLLLAQEGFEFVIPLGDNCFPKAQINFYFSQTDKNKKHTGGGNLFDWVAPNRLDLLAKALENKLEGACDAEMVVSPTPWVKGGYSPVDRYQIRWSHLFDKNHHVAHRCHEVYATRPLLTQDLFNRFYSDELEKITYLKKKFLENKQRTLYVITGPFLQDKTYFTLESIIKLKNALGSLRGDNNFLLLVIYFQSNSISFEENTDPLIKFESIIHTPGFDYINKKHQRFFEIMDQIAFV